MKMPEEYEGREQSYLKHRVLREYLLRWGLKIGSLSRGGPVRLCYVDCFSGPWKNKSQLLEDTSIHIGLRALEEAAQVWQQKGHHISVHALFVEKDEAAYHQLAAYLRERKGQVRTTSFHGEFGQHVDKLARKLGPDPAFIFVDPTGFKGVAMRYIAKLTEPRMRDVLVNVMFNDINRFKDYQQDFLRSQFRDFFGDELPHGLDEAGLMTRYRDNLKEKCGLTYAADLAIPHRTNERTWFRLVIGGKDAKVPEVFRDVEAKVMGREAASVRAAAKERRAEQRTGQVTLGFDWSPKQDPWYERENRRGREAAISALEDLAAVSGHVTFSDVWPRILETHHVTRGELAMLAFEAVRAGRLRLESKRNRPKTVKDDDVLRAISAGTPVDDDRRS